MENGIMIVRFKAQDQWGHLRELLAALTEIMFPDPDELYFKWEARLQHSLITCRQQQRGLKSENKHMDPFYFPQVESVVEFIDFDPK